MARKPARLRQQRRVGVDRADDLQGAFRLDRGPQARAGADWRSDMLENLASEA